MAYIQGLCIDMMISKDGQEEGKTFTDGWEGL